MGVEVEAQVHAESRTEDDEVVRTVMLILAESLLLALYITTVASLHWMGVPGDLNYNIRIGLFTYDASWLYTTETFSCSQLPDGACSQLTLVRAFAVLAILFMGFALFLSCVALCDCREEAGQTSAGLILFAGVFGLVTWVAYHPSLSNAIKTSSYMNNLDTTATTYYATSTDEYSSDDLRVEWCWYMQIAISLCCFPLAYAAFRFFDAEDEYFKPYNKPSDEKIKRVGVYAANRY